MITASVGYYVADVHCLLGASGGVYCLIAASLSDSLVNWQESKAVFLPRCRDGRVAHACDGKLLRTVKLASVLAFALFDIGYVLSGSAGELVSVWAHVFGTLAGLMVGLCWIKDQNEVVWEKRAKLVSGSLFGAAFVVALGLNIAGYSDVL